MSNSHETSMHNVYFIMGICINFPSCVLKGMHPKGFFIFKAKHTSSERTFASFSGWGVKTQDERYCKQIQWKVHHFVEGNFMKPLTQHFDHHNLSSTTINRF